MDITVSGDAMEYLHKVADPSKVLPALQRAMDGQNLITAGYISQKYLRLPGNGPTSMDGLRFRTGRLFGSIRPSKATLSGDGIVSAIGSNMQYAAILEFGGTTSPHVILPKRKKALAFGGKCYGKVNHPGSKIEGRHYVRRGIQDRLGDYTSAFTKTIFTLS